MSDFTTTPEARGYRPTLLINPFHPSIQTTVEGEGESAETVYKATFNQAYVYEHSVGLISPITISNMDTNYTIETDKKYIFYVELYVDDNNNVSNAYFARQEAGVDEEYPEMPDDTASVKHFEVCKMQGLSLTSVKLRENIHWSGSSGGGGFAHPWKATDNGNAFITIAAGEVFRLNSSGFLPLWWTPLSYAGGSIECTGGDGDGYILIDMNTTDLNGGGTAAGDSALVTTPTDFSLVFSFNEDGGSGNMIFPICEVNVSGGVATVTKQLLTHNPHLSVTSVSPV